MDESTLDRLLLEARPDRELTQSTASLLKQIAEEQEQRSRRRVGAKSASIVAGCILGALSIGVGTSVLAGPGVAHWWLWIPENDLTYVTRPFELNGVTTTCTFNLRILSTGQPADDAAAVQRLYDAREWLSSISLADYESQASATMDHDAGWPPGMETWDQRLMVGDQPYELAHANALMSAVSEAMRNEGLMGEGVSLEGNGRCTDEDGR
jgi:hypothetical protein